MFGLKIKSIFTPMALFGVVLASCAAPTGSVVEQLTEDQQVAIDNQIYMLGAGDRLRIAVFDEPELSGEYQVGSEGTVSLPLIGTVSAKDQTVSQLTDLVTARFKNGFINEPRVSVEVLNYRPFYITGEVDAGGEYSYKAGMTVLNAIAIAGGYTYRARTGEVVITREIDGKKVELQADHDHLVLPGDVIKVRQRFF